VRRAHHRGRKPAAKNPVQCQKGLRLPHVLRQQGSEVQCAETLFGWCWPRRFVRPEYGHADGYGAMHARGLQPSKHCRRQTSLTAGTLLADTKLPLTLLFLALYLLNRPKNGSSTLELKRQLGVSYPSVWSIQHKRLQTMLERDASRRLTRVIRSDEMHWGEGCRGNARDAARPTRHPWSPPRPTTCSTASATPTWPLGRQHSSTTTVSPSAAASPASAASPPPASSTSQSSPAALRPVRVWTLTDTQSPRRRRVITVAVPARSRHWHIGSLPAGSRLADDSGARPSLPGSWSAQRDDWPVTCPVAHGGSKGSGAWKRRHRPLLLRTRPR